jgi:hypothetical protein
MTELILISLLLYFLPTFIAVARNHKEQVAIFVLNLLLGWTFLGWIGAFVWCFTSQTKNQNYNIDVNMSNK